MRLAQDFQYPFDDIPTAPRTSAEALDEISSDMLQTQKAEAKQAWLEDMRGAAHDASPAAFKFLR